MGKLIAKTAEDKVILKDALRTRGMTQAELAEQMGVKQSTLSGNITRNRMGLDVFTKVLNELDYDVAVIDRKSGRTYWVVEVENEN